MTNHREARYLCCVAPYIADSWAVRRYEYLMGCVMRDVRVRHFWQDYDQDDVSDGDIDVAVNSEERTFSGPQGSGTAAST